MYIHYFIYTQSFSVLGIEDCKNVTDVALASSLSEVDS